MNAIERDIAPRVLRWELFFVCVFSWAIFISIPLCLGEIGLSWDTLNHHIYLGWTAGQSRFDRDFLAASYQSYQFPYLYWPVYKLSTSGLSGAFSGAILATLSWLAVPPIWLIAQVCISGRRWFDVFMRMLAVVLAFLSILVLSLLDSTANDLLAAVPFVWAMAFALGAIDNDQQWNVKAFRLVIISGFLAGASVACKLSNGPLAILLPGLWLLSASTFKARALNTAMGVASTIVGFFIVYGYWGWELWVNFGNPIYPFYDSWFAALRVFAGWQP